MSEIQMIPCDQVIIRLWEYIDGELDEQSSAEVAAHLEMCARCFPHYDFQKTYKEFLRQTAQREIPQELRRKVFEAILHEQDGNGSTGNGGGSGPGARIRRAIRSIFGLR